MSKLPDLKERGATNSRDMSIEGKIRFKFNTKVTCMRGGRNNSTMKTERAVKNFGTLKGGTNEKIFSFVWVYGKAVKCEPRIN